MECKYMTFWSKLYRFSQKHPRARTNTRVIITTVPLKWTNRSLK